jgi:hypothetical protein
VKKVGRVFGGIDNGSDFTVMSKAVGYVLKDSSRHRSMGSTPSARLPIMVNIESDAERDS